MLSLICTDELPATLRVEYELPAAPTLHAMTFNDSEDELPAPPTVSIVDESMLPTPDPKRARMSGSEDLDLCTPDGKSLMPARPIVTWNHGRHEGNEKGHEEGSSTCSTSHEEDGNEGREEVRSCLGIVGRPIDQRLAATH